MTQFWVSLADIAGRFHVSKGVKVVLGWLGAQVFEELDARGVRTGRQGRVKGGDSEVDLSIGLPIAFSKSDYQTIPYKRLRMLRIPPRLDDGSAPETLGHAYRDGYFTDIINAYHGQPRFVAHQELFVAAALYQAGRFDESLDVLGSVPEELASDSLSLLRLQVEVDTLRHCGRPARALEALERGPTFEGTSASLRSRRLVLEATARRAADSRDALAIRAIDHAISLLSEQQPLELAEALMHRARFLREDERQDDARALLMRALKLVQGSPALHLCGRILGNIAGTDLDQGHTECTLLFASAAAVCFRHLGCLHDLTRALAIIAAEETNPERKARITKEATALADQLGQPSYARSYPVAMAVDACSPEDLSCIRSADGVGLHVLQSWCEKRAVATGIDPRQLLSWAVLGVKMYHATVRRGRPAVVLDGDVVVGVAERWFGALEEQGTEENVQYRGILHYLENEFPGMHLEFASSALCHFRTQVNIPLDGDAESIVQGIILDALLMGFRLEFAFDNACAELLEQSQMVGGLEELVRLPSGTDEIDVVNLTDLTRLLVPSALPWPSDLRCRCGANLTHFIYCCSPESPIDIESNRSALKPGFQIERGYCGARLSGFRCDCCHQLYTWDLGLGEGDGLE